MIDWSERNKLICGRRQCSPWRVNVFNYHINVWVTADWAIYWDGVGGMQVYCWVQCWKGKFILSIRIKCESWILLIISIILCLPDTHIQGWLFSNWWIDCPIQDKGYLSCFNQIIINISPCSYHLVSKYLENHWGLTVLNTFRKAFQMNH